MDETLISHFIGGQAVARPGARHAEGFSPEGFELIEQGEPVADEQQVEISAADLGFRRQAQTRDARLRLRGGEGGDRFAQAELAGPHEGLGCHHRYEALGHAADLEAREAVVLNADLQHGVEPGAGLGHPLQLSPSDVLGSRQLDPQLAPGRELAVVAPQGLHGLGGVARAERRIVAVGGHGQSRGPGAGSRERSQLDCWSR